MKLILVKMLGLKPLTNLLNMQKVTRVIMLPKALVANI